MVELIFYHNYFFLYLNWKTSGLDHSWPDNIEHKEPELSICCLAMYVNCNLPGETWSISTAFAACFTGLFNDLFKFYMSHPFI